MAKGALFPLDFLKPNTWIQGQKVVSNPWGMGGWTTIWSHFLIKLRGGNRFGWPPDLPALLTKQFWFLILNLNQV